MSLIVYLIIFVAPAPTFYPQNFFGNESAQFRIMFPLYSPENKIKVVKNKGILDSNGTRNTCL